MVAPLLLVAFLISGPLGSGAVLYAACSLAVLALVAEQALLRLGLFLTAPDRLLLALAAIGTAGGAIGALMGSSSPAIALFFPLGSAGLMHATKRARTPAAADKAVLGLEVASLIFVLLSAAVALSPLLLPRTEFLSHNGAFVLVGALGLSVANRRWPWAIATSAVAVVVFLQYPALTYALALIAGALVYVLGARTRLLLGGLTCLIVGLALVGFLVEPTSSNAAAGYFAAVGKSDNSSTREVLWDAARQEFDASPIWGSAFTGDVAIEVPDGLTGDVRRVPLHNDFLQLAALGGLVGLGLFAWWAISAIALGLRAVRSSAAGRDQRQLKALLASFVAFLVVCTANPVLSSPALSCAVGALYSVLIQRASVMSDEQSTMQE